jgi:hypothetical protein
MCWSCDAGVEQAGIKPALAARARAIEATMPGTRASDQDWRILLGQEGGALAWSITQRLFTCLDEAATRPGSRLVCR